MNRIFGFSPKTALAIISHLGSAAEAFRLSEKELDDILGPYSQHRRQISIFLVLFIIFSSSFINYTLILSSFTENYNI